MRIEIATLMVPVDGDHPNDAQLQSVGAFADGLGAKVIGVSACDHEPSFYFAAGAVAIDILEEDEARMNERIAAAEKRCRKVLAAQRLPMEWRSAICMPTDAVVRESRAADLLVCFPRRRQTTYSDIDAGELVVKSGRPVLIVPEAANLRSPERILISWKDSRESRRAVRDALPFLRRAQRVEIVEIVEGEESPSQAEARIHDMVGWLKMHSVEAVPQVITPRSGVIDALADAASAFNADWIVAGGYGHTRLGEWIFGGVTRFLLSECDRPVFLSH